MQYALGLSYLKGRSVAVDYNLAGYRFEQSALQEYPKAIEELKKFRKNSYDKWVLK